jgi:hypothetical protein
MSSLKIVDLVRLQGPEESQSTRLQRAPPPAVKVGQRPAPEEVELQLVVAVRPSHETGPPPLTREPIRLKLGAPFIERASPGNLGIRHVGLEITVDVLADIPQIVSPPTTRQSIVSPTTD